MTELNASIRCFVAVELPEQIQELLSSVQDRLRERLGQAEAVVRWTRPEGTHLTLQFLGEVPLRTVHLIKEALREGCDGGRSLTLRVEGLGAFPNESRARVIWVGLQGDLDALHRLEKKIERALEPLGFRPDKPFNPHITLGRVREEATREDHAAIRAALTGEDQVTFRPAEFQVRGISLMRSQLHRQGAIYTQLDCVALEGAD